MNNNWMNSIKTLLIAFLYCSNPFDAVPGQANENYIDFSSASLVQFTESSMVEEAAVEMLVEEVEKRMTFRIDPSRNLPQDNVPVIVVGTIASFQKNASPDLISHLSKNNDSLPDGFHVQYLEHVRGAPTLL